MKRMLALLCGTFLILAAAGAGTAAAGHEEKDGPGPNGHNNKGLCTAYFNGQKKGHTEGEGPGPFGALEDEADDGDGDDPNDPEDGTDDLPDEMQISDDVFEFCQGLIGGQPEHNGRFDCRNSDGTIRNSDGDDEFECVENTNEGPSGGDHPNGKG